jgi:predicted nucleic-acid-binding protein
MIGLDTNVLIRYIVQDDPLQAAMANAFIEANCTVESPGFICNIVLVELVWVLERGYGYDKKLIVDVLKQVASTSELRLENISLAWQAILDFQNGSAGFADYLLAQINRTHGCEFTYTFDRKAAKSGAYKLIEMP